jgi:hypothetical protein
LHGIIKNDVESFDVRGAQASSCLQFHADHPVFSCSKSEQKQLNTWVSFQSAEEPLLGQFSVSGNSDTSHA